MAYCLVPLLLSAGIGCGSSGSSDGGGDGGGPLPSGGDGSGGSTDAGGTSDAGTSSDAANAEADDAAGTDGSSGGTEDGGGSAGDAGNEASADGGDSGGIASDYPYCNYGNVPSATAPSPWMDDPALTPIGLNPYGAPTTTVPGGYILISEGPQGTTQVPQATQSSILTRVNDELKFETSYSYVHLPPWATGATGTHYIDYLLVDTGFPNDPNAEGDSSYEGSYPDVETTQVAMTDQSQRYDLTHEFNHVLENSYGTVPGQKVSRIQESYNDYLILLTAENANGVAPGQATQFKLPSNVGYLDALVYQQSFAPIESCGIAVADGSSVNGPADYFTDITGFRYNDLFPLCAATRHGRDFGVQSAGSDGFHVHHVDQAAQEQRRHRRRYQRHDERLQGRAVVRVGSQRDVRLLHSGHRRHRCAYESHLLLTVNNARPLDKEPSTS